MRDKDLESQVKETELHRKLWQKRVELLVNLNAPNSLIEETKRISNLTHWEYNLECVERESSRKKQISEYAKNNPLKESVVREIFRRYDEFVKNSDLLTEDQKYLYSSSIVRWCSDIIRPLQIEGLSEKDFDMNLYDPIIRSLQKRFNEELSA